MASFEDLDQQPVYDRFKAAFSEADTLNLVVNFDSEAAFAALNIELSGIEGVLEAEVSHVTGQTHLLKNTSKC